MIRMNKQSALKQVRVVMVAKCWS